VKYRVLKDCDWKDFAARAVKAGDPPVIDEADLKTGDGKPLPKEVVDRLVKVKALAPLAEGE